MHVSWLSFMFKTKEAVNQENHIQRIKKKVKGTVERFTSYYFFELNSFFNSKIDLK